MEAEAPLKLILTGQEALWKELKRTAHADLIHRISVKYHLPPLTVEETGAYIDYQMRSAGGTDKTFLKEAKELVESAPCVVKESVGKDEAEEVKKKFEAAGAQAEIK